MSLSLRAIAAALILVVAALPASGVVCAGRCAMAHEAATMPQHAPHSEAPEHCHDGGVTDTAAIAADVTDCSLMVPGQVAARDRSSAPVQLPHVTPNPLAHSALLSTALAVGSAGLDARTTRLSPGTAIPLRI